MVQTVSHEVDATLREYFEEEHFATSRAHANVMMATGGIWARRYAAQKPRLGGAATFTGEEAALCDFLTLSGVGLTTGRRTWRRPADATLARRIATRLASCSISSSVPLTPTPP